MPAIGADLAPSTTEGGTGLKGLERATTVISEGQYNAIAIPKGGLTPATITAMVGMAQGGGAAIDLSPKVTAAMTKLDQARFGGDPALAANANIAYNTLTNIQSRLFNRDDAGGFGKIISSIKSHQNDTNDLLNTTNFLSNSSYSDFGSGITDMSSMGDRGLTNILGSLPGAGKAMASTGTMFNGIDVKNFGTPSGMVEALTKNKLANATGVNQKLIEAGVDLNDIHNPVYADKISSVLTNIKDPAAINATAEQFEINNPFAGLPSYTGSDSSLYKTPDFLTGGSGTAPTATTVPTAGTSTFGAPTTTGFPTASGTSRQGGSFGSEQIQGQTGTGMQGLKDLSDYTKTANPADTAGFAGMGELTTKFKDMGGGTIIDAVKAPSFFANIQKVPTPLVNSAHPTLKSLMTDNAPTITALTGTSTIPNFIDYLHPIAGGSESLAIISGGIANASILSGSAVDGSNYFTYVTDQSSGGATFNITITDGVYFEVDVVSAGSGYNVGQQITILGSKLGGSTPDNDLIISVVDVNNSGLNSNNIISYITSLNKANTLINAAGITAAATPNAQSLSGVMSFATKLPAYGKDMSEGGLGSILKSMANTSTKYGEAVKASLAEGRNNDLLGANGIGPLKTNPFEGVPAYAGEDSSLATNAGAKIMGGGGGPTPTPSQGTPSGSSRQGGSFGSEQIQGQVGTGTAGLRGTPFDLSGGR
jgi:hypothetical protein